MKTTLISPPRESWPHNFPPRRGLEQTAAGGHAAGVTFDKDIQPIFKAACVRCHGAERPGTTSPGHARRRFERHQAGFDSHGRRQRQQPARQSRFATRSETAMPPKPRARRGPGGPPAPMLPRCRRAMAVPKAAARRASAAMVITAPVASRPGATATVRPAARKARTAAL